VLGAQAAGAQSDVYSAVSRDSRQINDLIVGKGLAEIALRPPAAKRAQPKPARRPARPARNKPKGAPAPAPEPEPEPEVVPATRPAGTTLFRPVAQSLMPRMLASQFSTNAQERQLMEQVFSQCLQFYEDRAREQNVPLHDVASATSYFININYLVYSDGRGMTAQQFAALKNMIRSNLASSEKFQAMSHREKQELYEMLSIIGSFVMAGYTLAEQQGNQQAQAAIRQVAEQALGAALGAPISRVSFTDQGVQIR
jgi:hypothetical protein